ncbi:T9SS type A sorting domain-containing protein [Polaribacter vadi]|uniref:T9SS type A sorting domain-containing protein n=1 Tax=Polaribacter TaxID=52959 RepID=UPI001C0A4436|nr:MULTISPECIES: T9SS type A sorting domain-containing protein [Polaribacter]MBU3012969.1 T9SS type A sorting domain-containing protein [Polaribacter vadi]MDO6742787.1 T9SS type A sorting domain-containing protein [Polaribacter sp. 1_MG-2023]
MKKKLLFTLFLCISCLAFSQEKTINKLSAVPNPFTNSTKIIFNSSYSSQATFTVKNVLGKTVYSKKLNTIKGRNSVPFYKGNLSKGIYIYTLQDKKQITSKRFVIQ